MAGDIDQDNLQLTHVSRALLKLLISLKLWKQSKNCTNIFEKLVKILGTQIFAGDGASLIALVGGTSIVVWWAVS